MTKVNAVPSGVPMPIDRAKNAKSSDSRGLARSNGQDLMRGEHTVGGPRADADRNSNINGAPPRPDCPVGTGTENMAAGTSIFDPVLCELAYRWFSPEGGSVLDPFAGGSVRGIVAAWLGRKYIGVDLSARQIEANRQQWGAMTKEDKPDPRWITGDSTKITELAPGSYDLVFSCPPYFDLEVYSEDPGDLSTMNYAAFITQYRLIIAQAVSMLKPNRFACFVVGDVRDKKGYYRGLVDDTIHAFEDAGMNLYNQAILVTAVGSLPIRVGRQFGQYRKLGCTHQYVLVFFNGDPKTIPAELGEVEVSEDLSNEFGEEL